MALTLADALRQTGYAQDGQLQAPAPTQPNLSTMAGDYFAQLPEKTAQNAINTNNIVQNAMPYNFEAHQFEHGPTYNEFVNQVPNLMGITVPNNSLANAVRSTKIGSFDARFDPRKLELEKIENTVPHVEQLNLTPIPKVSLADYEGRPFITSMSDRTAAGGDLLGVNNVMYKRPVHLHGGQDYMFNNPDQVWASAQQAVSPIIKNAEILKEATGKNPLYIPWRMAPTSGDFAHMTGESMIAHAEAAMDKSDKKLLNNAIKDCCPIGKA